MKSSSGEPGTQLSNGPSSYGRIDRQRLRRLLVTGPLRWLDDVDLPDDEAAERAAGALIALSWGIRWNHRRERWLARDAVWAQAAATVERS